MRKIFLLMSVFMTIFSLKVSANNFLGKDLLLQLYDLQDSSLLYIKEGKCYLNEDKMIISNGRIALNSDYFGLLTFSHVLQDGEGMYIVGVFTQYICDCCGRYYNREPAECGTCGCTSFTRSEALPDCLRSCL